MRMNLCRYGEVESEDPYNDPVAVRMKASLQKKKQISIAQAKGANNM